MLPRDDGEHWKIEVYRDRLKRSLAARFVLRYHVAMILLASILGGWAVDVALLRSGLTSMLARYPLAVIGAYGFFVAGIALWLRYSGIGEYVKAVRADELVGQGAPDAKERRSLDSSDWLQGAGVLDPEGCLIMLAIAVAFFALGGYAVVAAEALIADVVLELLLAAGLLRGVRRLQRSGWFGSLWRNTWLSLAFSLIVAAFVGLFAQGMAPKATTLHEAWTMIKAGKKAS